MPTLCQSPTELCCFSENPCEWQEFIENFRTRVLLKTTFNNNLRMKRLCNVLYGELQRVIETIGNTRCFHATAMKTVEHDFRNPLLMSNLNCYLINSKLKLLIGYLSSGFISKLK